MNWERDKGQMKKPKKNVMRHREKLKNKEFVSIAVKPKQLVRTLQDKYGISKKEAERQVSQFKKIVDQ